MVMRRILTFRGDNLRVGFWTGFESREHALRNDSSNQVGRMVPLETFLTLKIVLLSLNTDDLLLAEKGAEQMGLLMPVISRSKRIERKGRAGELGQNLFVSCDERNAQTLGKSNKFAIVC